MVAGHPFTQRRYRQHRVPGERQSMYEIPLNPPLGKGDFDAPPLKKRRPKGRESGAVPKVVKSDPFSD